MNQKLTTITAELQAHPHYAWVFELLKEGVEVFVVGGKVRDTLLERECHDYDFVVRGMNAEALQLFLSKHGEVNVVGKSFGVFIFVPKGSDIAGIEIALPRTETSFNTGGYHDFDVTADPTLPIERDLERRDFTINAMAFNVATGELIDPFDGQGDLERRLIRAVGDAATRFGEDYTRMTRAVRFAAQLDFTIEPDTLAALTTHAQHILKTPVERTQQELNKILLSGNVEHGFTYLEQTGLVHHILPEIAENIGVEQGKAHIYTVYTHLVKAAQFASSKGYSLDIVLAALFHDCGKKRTKQIINGVDTYYQHEYVGEAMAREALNRLKYPKATVQKVSHLVRNHMFYYNMGEVSDAGVRRLIAKVGPEHINDLIRLRMADRKGMGRPKAKPFKLQELERRITILQTDPISVNMLAIDGDEMMELLQIGPSIRLKYLKQALLAEVLEDPSKNANDYLRQRVQELHKLSDDELQALGPDLEREERERQQALLKKFKGVS